MLKISLLEFFLRAVPEAFLLILGTYILCDKKINKKDYLLSSVVLSVCIYAVRMLPIHFGVHTIINMITYIVISFKINKIPINNAIPNSIILTIMLCICEFINIVMIQEFVKCDIQLVLYSNIGKTLIFIFSLILFALSIVLLYLIVNKIKKQRKCT